MFSAYTHLICITTLTMFLTLDLKNCQPFDIYSVEGADIEICMNVVMSAYSNGCLLPSHTSACLKAFKTTVTRNLFY